MVAIKAYFSQLLPTDQLLMEPIHAHKERRLNEIAALKVAILTAARSLAKSEGWTKVSIRKIAREIKYTPPVIYEHFKNKEAILIELETFGFRQLRHALEDAGDPSASPLSRLLSMSETYWDWTFEHKELYEVMFNLDGIRCSQPNTKALKESGEPVIAVLQELHLFDTGIEELFFNWWAIMHGHVSLILSGQVHGMSHQLRGYMKAAINRLG